MHPIIALDVTQQSSEYRALTPEHPAQTLELFGMRITARAARQLFPLALVRA